MDLLVGDLHAQISNIEETDKLLRFIRDVFVEKQCKRLIFLGDLFHTHAVVRQEIAYQLLSFFKQVYFEIGCVKSRIIILAGNHDGISPTNASQNALDLILGEFATIISNPSGLIIDNEYVAMPFIADSAQFTQTANLLFNQIISTGVSNPVLLCHQTFDGAAYETGMLCPHGANSDELMYTTVIAGHIHKRQVIKNKIIYIGTPRPVTFGEANDEKFIFLLEKNNGMVELTPVSTKNTVRHYYKFDIIEGDITDLDLTGVDLNKDKVTIKISGTESFCLDAKKQLSSMAGKIRLIMDIKKPRSASISLEKTNSTIEDALLGYVASLDIDQDMKEDICSQLKILMLA